MQKRYRLNWSHLCHCQQEHFICSNVILSWAKQNHTIKLKTHQTVCFKGINQSVNLKEKPFSSLLSCTDSFLALSISSLLIHELTLTLDHWDKTSNEMWAAFATIYKTSNSFLSESVDPELEQTSLLTVLWTYRSLGSSIIPRLWNLPRDTHLVVTEWGNKSTEQQSLQGNHFTPCPHVPVFFPLKKESKGKSGNLKLWHIMECFLNSFGEKCCCLLPSRLALSCIVQVCRISEAQGFSACLTLSSKSQRSVSKEGISVKPSDSI